MTFTIEPMLNAGSRHTKLSKKDGWTVTNRSQIVRTMGDTKAVTAGGCEILTLRGEEPVKLDESSVSESEPSKPLPKAQLIDRETLAELFYCKDSHHTAELRTILAEATATLNEYYRQNLISATSSAAALTWLILFSTGFGPATPNCKQMKSRLLRSGGMVAAS